MKTLREEKTPAFTDHHEELNQKTVKKKIRFQNFILVEIFFIKFLFNPFDHDDGRFFSTKAENIYLK